MKVQTYLFILLALVTLVACSNVLKLTDQNFLQTITKNKYVMVKFYAPWCGHCKTMIPQYEKLAQLAKDNGIIIGELDATQQKKTAAEFKIQGYPTMNFFIDGQPIQYSGQRTTDQMYAWIKKVTQIKFQAINSQKIQQLRKNQNFVVYFGTDAKKIKMIQHFNIIDSTITYFTSTQARPENDKLTLFFNGSSQQKDYPSDLEFSEQQVKNWILSSTVPSVVSLSKKQYLDWVFYDQKTMKDVFLFLQESDTNDQVYSTYQKICANNKDKFKCSHATNSVEIYSGVKNYLNGTGKSILALIRDGFKQAYIFDGKLNQLSEQSIFKFTKQVDNKAHVNIAAKQVQQKSEIHYQNVKDLTDEKFESFIKQNEIVFVEFYSQQCQHCVQFASKYETFAQKAIKENKKYVLAAVDANKNTKIAKINQIKSYPTFIIYVHQQAIIYQDSRAEQDIFSFLDSIVNAKIISVGSIAQIPSPSVVIYGSIQKSNIKILPALFTRYPIYHLKQGKQLKIVLRLEKQQNYQGELKVHQVSVWLNQRTEPVLVDLLSSNVQKKLMNALENQIPIISFVDIQSELSASLLKTLQQYCKTSPYLCGYAKKDNDNFNEFSQWTGLPSTDKSQIVFINTETFEKYLFDKQLSELTKQTIQQFIQDIKDKKIIKLNPEQGIVQQNKQTKQDNISTQEIKTQTEVQKQSQSSSNDQNQNIKQSQLQL